MVKASLVQIEQFVNYHLRAGASHIFLFFDDPFDEVASAFEGKSGVVVVRCDRHFWDWCIDHAPSEIQGNALDNLSQRQQLASVLALSMAKDRECDWIVYIDIDELLFPANRLLYALNSAPRHVSVIRFLVYEAIPSISPSQGAFIDTCLFKKGLASKSRTDLLDGWGGLFERARDTLRGLLFKFRASLAKSLGAGRFFKLSYYLGHTGGKSATRVCGDVSYLNAHGPVSTLTGELRLKTASGVQLLHYDCQGYEEWKRKWGARVEAGYRPRNKKRIAQYDAFRPLYLKGDNEELFQLYKKLYSISRYEKMVLRMLGLLVNIELGSVLFCPKQTEKS